GRQPLLGRLGHHRPPGRRRRPPRLRGRRPGPNGATAGRGGVASRRAAIPGPGGERLRRHHPPGRRPPPARDDPPHPPRPPPATLRGLGYAPEEYLGRDALELLHPDDAPAVREFLAGLLRQPGGRAPTQYRMRHKDGSWRWLEAVATNLLDEPAVRAVVVN